MSMIPPTGATGYPFGFSRNDYRAALREIPTRDLLAELESWQWVALDEADSLDGSRAYCEAQIATMVEELERRHRLLLARRNDPLRPRWPPDRDRFRDRIASVSARWTAKRVCKELLRLDPAPIGHGRFKTSFPLPGPDDANPSFFIFPDGGWKCFSCGRGGGSIKLVQYALNLPRFTDALAMLEREAGDGR